MDLAISQRSEFLAKVTNVAFIRSPGAGGESWLRESSSGLMLGVVPGRTVVSGVGLGGLARAEEKSAEEYGFSRPIPTGLFVVEPVELIGGV